MSPEDKSAKHDTAPQRTSGKRVTLNAMSNLAVMGVDMAIQICLLKFILKVLPKDIYGIWAITGGLFAYSAMLQLGINSAVNYFIPPMFARRDHAGLNKVVSTAVVFYSIVSLLVLSATIVLYAYFPIWFNIAPENAQLSRTLVAIVGIYFGMATPLTVFRGVMSGLQRYVPLNTLSLCCRISRAVLIVTLLLLDFGVMGLAIAHVCSRLAEAIGAPLLVRRYLPELRIRWSNASLPQFREMVSYSIFTLMWSMFDTVRDRAGFIVIGVLLATESATLYTIPVMIMQAVYAIVRASASVTKPAASSLMAEGDSGKIRSLVLKGNRFVGSLVLALAAVLIILGKPIIRVWVGEDYVPMAGILTLFLGCELLTLVQLVPAYVLIGLGKQKPLAYFSLAMVATGITLMVVMVAVFKTGLWGIAFGGSLPALFYGMFVLPTYTCREIGASLPTYLNATVVRPILTVSLFIATLWALREFYAPRTIVDLLTVGMISGSVLAVCGVIFLMNRSERSRSWALAKKICRAPMGSRA